MKWTLFGLGVGIITAIVTASVIYFTPLRYAPFIPPPAMHEMSPTAFYTLFKAHPEEYMFIDVRPEDLYAKEHAVGSINIPVWHLFTVKATLPRSGKTLALICGGDETSSVGYSYLQHFGFTNLLRIPGGVPAWALSGLPIEGTEVSSSTRVLSVADQQRFVCPQSL
jgi:rhodanese-related sulfurtransferase